MPWDSQKLNNGASVPGIAFGTSGLGNEQAGVDYIAQAITVGFTHIDTAEIYGNEEAAGKAIRASGVDRSKIFVTTKYWGDGGKDVRTSFNGSLQKLGVDFVDLYLVHNPRIAKPDVGTVWKEFEKIYEEGKVKAIGVSNFKEDVLGELLGACKVKPAVNQIYFHPYVYEEYRPVLELAAKEGIVVEGYGALTPLTEQPGGPVDPVIRELATDHKVEPNQILLAWAKAKGLVIVTQSRKKERLQAYLAAGDLELTESNIRAIDEAGAKEAPPMIERNMD